MEIRAYPKTYKINGDKFDRVTSVLGEFVPRQLFDWALKTGKKDYKNTTKTAKGIGTRVDKIYQAILEKKHYAITINDHPAIQNCVDGFNNWLKEEKPEILDWQRTLWSKALGIAGTLDLLLPKEINDVKCSNAIRLNNWIQVAVYAKLYMITTGEEIKWLSILRLDKLTGDYQYKRIAYTEDLFNLYLGILNHYRFNRLYDKKGGKEKLEDGVKDTATEMEKKFGVYAPSELPDWDKFKSEI